MSGVRPAAEALRHCCPFHVEFRGTFSHLNCVLAFGVRQSEFRGWTCYCLQCRVRSCMRTMIDASRGFGSEIGSGGSWTSLSCCGNCAVSSFKLILGVRLPVGPGLADPAV